ncbi:aspartyl protease family protein [Thermofilum pendens]|uniref:Clan AA aspartic protease n=1 Tax=Thermofilum pendens (strain DSM 2475 / Hrk 5) TaxID=368408 RepID=A1RYT9_THEPD|nr:aspartyl protease family protein [Thermofilum pendens]ABL78369.1 conserved hypothetical protein [Thermofilum pendens Hrk 5]
MGHVRVKAKVCDAQGARCIEAECLVDTGATLSVIPRSLARELGVEVVDRDRVETGAGVVEVDRGVALIEVEGRKTVSNVWISDVTDKVLIGAVTLELAGLKLDPRTGRLEPAQLLLHRLA